MLRQVPVPADAVALAHVTDDVAWLHGFLSRLAATGFPAPVPLPAFAGTSWTVSSGSLWTLVTFLPGQVVGWAPAPPMAEIGALLARYHAAASTITPAGQRPSALPLADVPAILQSGQLAAAGVPASQAALIRTLAAELASDLAGIDQAGSDRLTVHGDFTCHNVLAAGSPPTATGVIDFELAHAESALADIGYGLWRSGRPHQHADRLDVTRVRQFVHGYAGVRPITASQAAIIPVYLRGRGLQMIAKRIRAGQPETGMLAQVAWTRAHHAELAAALEASLRG
ncbi:MAG TPA: phosphotransferase [Streptosporangiaceae bacterium]|nr:phosphotransferase [Streptosporangiaceae bacterium]